MDPNLIINKTIFNQPVSISFNGNQKINITDQKTNKVWTAAYKSELGFFAWVKNLFSREWKGVSYEDPSKAPNFVEKFFTLFKSGKKQVTHKTTIWVKVDDLARKSSISVQKESSPAPPKPSPKKTAKKIETVAKKVLKELKQEEGEIKLGNHRYVALKTSEDKKAYPTVFKIEKQIGKGADKIAYLAQAEGTKDGPVALLEVSKPEQAEVEKELKIMDEIQDKEAIVQKGKLVNLQGKQWIIQKLYKGTLNFPQKDLPLKDAKLGAFFSMHLSQKMQKIHQSDVVINDVKPENIFVGDNNVPYFADLGNAQKKGEKTDASGTLKYMSPSQLKAFSFQVTYPRDFERAQRDDVYSIALIQYQMVFGGLPWNGRQDKLVKLIREVNKIEDKNSEEYLNKVRDLNLSLKEHEKSVRKEIKKLKNSVKPKGRFLEKKVYTPEQKFKLQLLDAMSGTTKASDTIEWLAKASEQYYRSFEG